MEGGEKVRKGIRGGRAFWISINVSEEIEKSVLRIKINFLYSYLTCL